jgi:hypothetical protein
MVKLTEADKQFVKLLILDCENFHLNKKESLAYISKKLNRKISRNSYYNCKREMADNDLIANVFPDSKWEKKFSMLHNIGERNRILNSSSDVRIKSHNVWNDPVFVGKYSDRFFADGYALVNETKKMSARLKSQEALSSTNYNSIPSTATIREEYIKCGNPYCSKCEHGPHYYGYWKENGKLKKKYIGKYDPSNEGSSENYELNF